MIGFSRFESNQIKPLLVVCGDEHLQTIDASQALSAIALSKWIDSNVTAHVVVCDARESVDVIQQIRHRDESIFIVAIVDRLDSESVDTLLLAGADNLVTENDITNGRLALLLRQRFTQKSQLANVKSLSDLAGQSTKQSAPDDAAEQVLAVERCALEKRKNFMTALSDVSMRLLERKSFDELMDHIAQQAVSLAGADSAFVSILHESGRYMEIVGASGHFVDFKGFKHVCAEDVAGLAWELEELVLMEDAAMEAAHIKLWGDSTKRCAVPFFSSGKFRGVVCVALDSIDNNLENYLDILKLFTRTVSIAIENSILVNEQKAELERTAAIGEITQSFYAASNLRELVDSVCKSLLGVFNSKHVTVCRVGSDGKFSLLAEWQKNDANISRVNFVNVKLLASSITQWSVDNRQSGLVKRGVEDKRDSAAVIKIKSLLGIGCSISLPLVQDDVVWGVLVLGKGVDQRDFTDVELSLLELLSSQLSSSVMRQNLLDKIHFQAFHDSLTKLPNRLKFESTLNGIVSADKPEKIALLFLDLDGFKAVNDNQGHSCGDELLKQVSRRLAGCLQENDLLARMGGDEFAVLLRGVKSRQNALSIAKRLSNSISQKFIVDKYNLKIGVSIGLSFYPDNGNTVDDLLRNADFAMYEAKAEGNSSVRSFNQAMAEQYRARAALEIDLLKALENEQFELHYQPKVDLVHGDVSGVEALLRWKHPKHGYVSPGDFVPLAAEAGYMTEIGRWVLHEAITQNTEWNANGLRNLSMAVNISAPQFVLDDFTSGVIATLTKNGLDPALLELEVTESVVMNNLSKVVRTLNELRDHGINIAIDDFGTGYSSLAYLENLPLDCMKIDKVFVDKLVTGDEQNSLVNTILTMARTLGLRTVAEGVETEAQLRNLIALGCECVQGYYFSEPVPAAEIPDTIVAIQSQFHSLRKAG